MADLGGARRMLDEGISSTPVHVVSVHSVVQPKGFIADSARLSVAKTTVYPATLAFVEQTGGRMPRAARKPWWRRTNFAVAAMEPPRPAFALGRPVNICRTRQERRSGLAFV